MQQSYNTPTTPKSGKVAFHYGLSGGLILAIVISNILLINAFTGDPNQISVPGSILGIVNLLLGLAAYFVVGILASKKTGKVGTGSIAGLWTGVFYGVIDAIVSIVLYFTVVAPKTHMPASVNSTTIQAAVTFGIILGAILGLLFAIGVGSGIGALGGQLGRNMFRGASASVYPNNLPQQYPPQQYPPQQQYPEQPYTPQPNSDPYSPYTNNPYKSSY